MMKKLVAIVLALLVIYSLAMACVDSTEIFMYNGGVHRHCGGTWRPCPRDMSRTWYYCSDCGCQMQNK